MQAKCIHDTKVLTTLQPKAGKLTLRKRHFFVIEKYAEDVKQNEKHVPDLLEAMMRPTRLVKEELQQILVKVSQFGSEIPKIKVSTFWILEV